MLNSIIIAQFFNKEKKNNFCARDGNIPARPAVLYTDETNHSGKETISMKNHIIRKGLCLWAALALIISLAACSPANGPVSSGESSEKPTSTVNPAPATENAAADTTGESSRETQPAASGDTPISPLPAGQAKAADLMERFSPEQVEEAPADERFRADMLRISASLFQEIYSRDKGDKTTLISPLSIVTALAMTANGARGETRQEMEQLLCGLDMSLEDLNAYLHTYLNALPDEEDSAFSFANSIWFKDMEGFTVEQDFLQKNVNYYGAGVFKAPFNDNTVRDINQWVALHTHDMIPSLLDKLDEAARMVLINALVFEAKWADPFDSDYDVRPDQFTGLKGETKTVEQMYAQERIYLSDESCRGFMKLYAGDRYRFVALLPNEGVDFNEFVLSLSGEKLGALLEGAVRGKVNIKLPKFSYDYDQSLTAVLESLGMKRAFTDGAQFEGISQDQYLYISDVLHKTHIDVDNEGTKAAAVTAVMVYETTSVPRPEEVYQVYLDRPFVYMIIDTENNLPLFMGTVTELGE